MRSISQSSNGSPAFYGLDFMANKAFRRKYCLNILQIYKFRNYLLSDGKKERKVLIMSVLIVNKDNFDSVRTSEKTVLLDFYADWCGPCRMVSPIVEEIAAENPQYLIGKINVDKEPELAEKFKVLSIPTLAVIKNGNVVSQSAGARPKADILAMLKG